MNVAGAPTRHDLTLTVPLVFTFRVRAIRQHADEGEWSDLVSRGASALTGAPPQPPPEPPTPPPEPPVTTPVPTGLALVPGTTDGSLVASWDANASATGGYVLAHRPVTSPAAVWTEARVSGTEFTLPSTTVGTTYQVRVASRTAAGTVSSWSSSVSAEARNLAPGPVTGFAIRGINVNDDFAVDGRVVITWNEVANAQRYRFQQFTARPTLANPGTPARSHDRTRLRPDG